MVKTSRINWDRPEKKVARNFMMGYSGKVAKTFLGLPGHSCLDPKEGLEEGSLNYNSFAIAVEREPENWRSIDNFLKKNFKKSYLFKGELHKLPLTEILAEYNANPVDFSFLDLCGHMNNKNAHWLYKNRENFADICRFGLTVPTLNRNKDNWETVAHKTAKKWDYVEFLEELLKDSRNNLAKHIYGIPIKVISDKQKIRKKRAAELTNTIRSIKAECYSFMVALNNRKIDIDRIYRYKDIDNDGKKHTEMALIDFRLNGYQIGDDLCMDMVKEYDKNAGYASQTLRYGRVAPYKKKVKKPVILKTYDDIAKHMKIEKRRSSVSKLPQGQQAWITMNAKRANLDPIKVKVQLDKLFKRNREAAA